MPGKKGAQLYCTSWHVGIPTPKTDGKNATLRESERGGKKEKKKKVFTPSFHQSNEIRMQLKPSHTHKVPK